MPLAVVINRAKKVYTLETCIVPRRKWNHDYEMAENLADEWAVTSGVFATRGIMSITGMYVIRDVTHDPANR